MFRRFGKIDENYTKLTPKYQINHSGAQLIDETGGRPLDPLGAIVNNNQKRIGMQSPQQISSESHKIESGPGQRPLIVWIRLDSESAGGPALRGQN